MVAIATLTKKGQIFVKRYGTQAKSNTVSKFDMFFRASFRKFLLQQNSPYFLRPEVHLCQDIQEWTK